MMRLSAQITLAAVAWLLSATPALAECVPHAAQDGWLIEQELQGGHTVGRHVAKSDEWLTDRLHREPWIPAASSFPDRQTARQVIALALGTDKTELDDWARTADPGEVAEIRMAFEQPIGRVVRRGRSAAEPGHGLRLFVKANGDGSCHLLTAYPTIYR